MSIFNELHDKTRFDSPREYKQLEKNLAGLIRDGIIVEVPVKTPVSPLGHVEYWYREEVSGEIYRYVPPEFPARGIWEKIS